jgi:hypothetical protein
MNSKGFWRIINYLITAINAIICTILLCVVCPRIDNLGFDYMGVVVAIFALLITMLIGWNIFSTLDFRKEVFAKIEECRKQFKHELYLHSELNNKDFNNVIKAINRAEDFCKKLDNVLYEHISNKQK